jgi:hypothetical protein
MQDAIGQRGEALFRVFMTPFDTPDGPLFRLQFLGDKWKAVDFVVELLHVPGLTPYFFVQVKATRQGLTVRDRRLKVQISAERVADLAAYPAPTYVAGIDVEEESGWIVSANGEHVASLSSLSTRHPINKPNRQALWDEVKAFWSAYPAAPFVSRFTDPAWK